MSMPLPEFSLERASSIAPEVDSLFHFLVLFCSGLAFAIAALIVYFSVRYRRKPERSKGAPITGNLSLELIWTLIPTLIGIYIFYWSARLYFNLATPPRDAMEIYVVAKQWMWKFQHPAGQTEIDELHVPVDRDIKLTMATEDVIHSFYVPAFRVKSDVVPGLSRYRTVWFRATKPGTYHLFCAEYCGTNHSGMIGWVIVLPKAEYEQWQATGKTTGSLAAQGEKLFQQLACNSCHRTDMQGRGPMLSGLYGHKVPLRGGQTVLADESYIRESILAPEAKLHAGFEPIMPSFRGLLTEEQVIRLVAYVKSLGEAPANVIEVSP